MFELKEGYDKELKEELVKMRDNQPHDASAGSCFKNPDGDYAGRLIDVCGLKGIRVGGMEFSTQHANFLVNLDNGTYEDAITLITMAKEKVKEQFDIELQEEVIII